MAVGIPASNSNHLPCASCRRRPRHKGQSYCRQCVREQNEISRMKLPAMQAIKAARSGPCMDCGLELPWQVMELDHVRGQKRFQLTWKFVRTGHSLDEVLAEIAKCERRCPNCHRMRHYRAARAD